LLKEIFQIVELPYSIDMIPWKRCTNLVYNYDISKKYEIFINGSYNKDRAKKYFLSDPIYFTHQAVFYSKDKYPNGVVANNHFDINKYNKICSVHGYDTELYYKEFGLNKNKKIDKGARTLISVLKKIDLGRCDMTISSQAPVYGGVAIGKYIFPKSIKSQVMPNSKATPFHIFISKSSPRGKELLKNK